MSEGTLVGKSCSSKTWTRLVTARRRTTSRGRRAANVLQACFATLLVLVASRAVDATLTLFPLSTFAITDNLTGDQAPSTTNTITRTTPWPVPLFPPLNVASDFTFTGDIVASTSPGTVTLTITNAVVKNTNTVSWAANGQHPGSPTDYGNMLPFVFLDHGPLFGPGSMSVTINGTVQGTGTGRVRDGCAVRQSTDSLARGVRLVVQRTGLRHRDGNPRYCRLPEHDYGTGPDVRLRQCGGGF